jgi:hypothetical protein
MEAGFLADTTYGAIKPGEWVGGAPESSWLTGTRVRGKDRYPLLALRCATCGYVKLYAQPATASARTYQELDARIERLEDELLRLAERERFLVDLLEGRGSAGRFGALGPGVPPPAPPDRRE